MEKNLATCVVAITLLAGLTCPAQLAAQYHHYKLIDLGTFGGPSSGFGSEPFLRVINLAGTVVGGADTSALTPEPGCYNPVNAPDCYISHAFAWSNGYLKDLGTLQGGNFSFASSINQHGLTAGVSENGQTDPATGNPEFHAVVWEGGRIRDLGTLGGTSSFAGTVNNLGQVAGNALNAIPDQYSMLGSGSQTTMTQTRAFLWQNGNMHDLGTLGGPDSWAGYINDLGQIAGTSYTSDIADRKTGVPPIGVFLWQNGKMKNLGGLGGDTGSLLGFAGIVSGLNNLGEVTGAMEIPGNQFLHAFLWNGSSLLDLGTLGGGGSLALGINDSGQVFGVSSLNGNRVLFHAFVTENGTMVDIGTTGGYACSVALGINSTGQTVGALTSSVDGCSAWRRAFLWENGEPMVDLNSLVPLDSPLQLFAAFNINDQGEIVGGGMPHSCTNSDTCPDNHAFLLIPCDQYHPGIQNCDYSLVETDTAAWTSAEQPAIPQEQPAPDQRNPIRPSRRGLRTPSLPRLLGPASWAPANLDNL